jgi:hypothetical protein
MLEGTLGGLHRSQPRIPATPATKVSMRIIGMLWTGRLLQKTPVLAMAQAQTCQRSRKCTKVASEPLIRGLISLRILGCCTLASIARANRETQRSYQTRRQEAHSIIAPEYESRLGPTSIGAIQIQFSLSFWRKQFIYYLSSSSKTTATLPDFPVAISAYASFAFSSGNLFVTRSSG